MKQFDVCPASGFAVGRRERLVIVLQHRHLIDLGTIVVAPLYLNNEIPPVRRMRPLASVSNQEYVIAIDRLGSIPKKQLGAPVSNLEHMRYELVSALDLLFSGI